MNISFSLLVSFLSIFQDLQCAFLIFLVCQFSCNIPCHTVFVSHFPLFQFSCHNLGPTVCLSHFHVFQCFSPYFKSYHVSLSFSSFVSFLAICHVLQCAFQIFHVCQFSMFQDLPCTFFIFHFFQCFSPYFW